MLFSSVLFLFRFFPAVFLIHTLAPKKFRNTVLFVSSLIFYSWGEARYFPIMFSVILINYFAAIFMEKAGDNKRLRKLIFLIAVIFDLGNLGFFKYSNFLLGSVNTVFGAALPLLPQVTLPLGISFYTFQIMAYTIDVYLGKEETEHNFINFGSFVVLFPQLIAGPIVMYSDIKNELKSRELSAEFIQSGIKLFVLGLSSKVILADGMGKLWTEVTELGFSSISTPLAWMGIFAYAFQLYFDFSGYSLMAIGLGRMLGFNFPQNFDNPYISKSITEFWRRWHITLSSWFREYLYFPLGGSRRSPLRNYLNLLIVWAATGLWHGAAWNFVAWGIYFFVFLSLERAFLGKFLQKHRAIAHIYAVVVILIGWSLFAIGDAGELGVFWGKLFAFAGGTDWIYYLRNFAVLFALSALLSTPALKAPFEKLCRNKGAEIVIYMGLLAVCTAFMVAGTFSPFLYFNF